MATCVQQPLFIGPMGGSYKQVWLYFHLLKVRVNEKYVLDAIAGLEEKLRKNLEDMNRGGINKLEKHIKELEKDLEKLSTDHNSKLKALKDDLYDK